jgi:hypothetical protein
MENNYSFTYEESNYGLVPEAVYEAILNLEKKVSPNTGSQFISLKWTIRDDVEQACQNRKVLESIWEDKENPGRFPTKKLSKILSIQGKNGKYNFDDIDEVLQFINGWNVRIGVKIGKPDDWHQEEYNYISFYGPTKFPNQTLEMNSNKVEFEVTDEDLPF